MLGITKFSDLFLIRGKMTQASGTEVINWGRTYMYTPDKYAEKNLQAPYSTNQSMYKQVSQKFFKRLNF